MITTTLLTDRVMYLPGREVRAVRPDTLAGGAAGVAGRFAAMLTRMSATEGTLILDAYAAHALDLPTDPGVIDGDTADHPAVAALRDAGWRISGLRGWSILWAPDRPTVHLGILPLIDPARSPIIAADHASTVEACELWRRLTGTVYHGTPGVAGISLVREVATSGTGRHGKAPTWQPRETGPGDAYELDYHLPGSEGGWRGVRPGDGDTHLHGYDAVRMYLPAMGSALMCPWTLRPTGPDVEWTPELAGWWLIEAAPWQDDRLPDPAGYPRTGHEGPRWVTAPTLALLHELMETGVHGGYVVKDSYTGPGVRVLRKWADIIRGAWLSPDSAATPGALDLPARTAVQTALKMTYRETFGMFNRDTSRVRRPDWHFAIIAQARANLWRRIESVGRNTDRWPSLIDVDNVYYAAADPDPVTAAPPAWPRPDGKLSGLVLGNLPGQFTPKTTRRL